MKKNIACLCGLLVLLPGCWRKKPSSNQTDAQGNVVLARESGSEQAGNKKKLFLDDSVDQFTLEEEAGFSPKALKDSKALALVESESMYEDAQLKAEQAKYGFKTVYFGFDQYAISPDQEAAVQANVPAAKKAIKDGYEISVIGHACNSAGSEAYNMHLSELRAKALKKELIKAGISADKIKTSGHGCAEPLVEVGREEKDAREKQAPNRRTEIRPIKA